MEQEVQPEQGAEVEAPVVETPETPEAETPVVETHEEEIKLPTPKKQTAQERINEITRKWREEQRETERLKRELAEKEKPAERSDRPKLENFQTQEQYEDALLEWNDNKRSKETAKERKQREEAELLAKFNEKAATLRQTYEDFDEVVENPVFSPIMRDALLRSDSGAMVSYFLGRPENRSLADKIRSLPDTLQVYELGKLETKLILASKTKTTTSAPAPIKPVGDGGGTAELDEEKMSDADWYKLEQKREYDKVKKKLGG